jgi:hypothetical protein
MAQQKTADVLTADPRPLADSVLILARISSNKAAPFFSLITFQATDPGHLHVFNEEPRELNDLSRGDDIRSSTP